MASDIYWGLAVSANNTSEITTSVFDHVTGSPALPMSWVGVHIGPEYGVGSNTLAPLIPVEGGGGAGGSIWLDVGSLAGSGMISANGAGSDQHGAGGGGRIAIYYATNAFTGNVRAYGGTPGDWTNHKTGGAGTIYWKGGGSPDLAGDPPLAGDDSGGALVIDNDDKFQYTTIDEDLTLTGLTILNEADLVIGSGHTLTLLGTDLIMSAESDLDVGNSSFIARSIVTLSDCGGLYLYPD